jgi:hypothetical protein
MGSDPSFLISPDTPLPGSSGRMAGTEGVNRFEKGSYNRDGSSVPHRTWKGRLLEIAERGA